MTRNSPNPSDDFRARTESTQAKTETLSASGTPGPRVITLHRGDGAVIRLEIPGGARRTPR